jgi:hypothetical protein
MPKSRARSLCGIIAEAPARFHRTGIGAGVGAASRRPSLASARRGATERLSYTRDMPAFVTTFEEGEVTRAKGWSAQLALRFERERRGTVLVRRSHQGPLRVLKALYPEGPEVCQAIIVHPPGGIAGGDVLDVAVEAGPGAQVQLTTPGAAKWYRSAGAYAESKLRIRAFPGSVVEWLPQEAIVFDRALASVATRIATPCSWAGTSSAWGAVRRASGSRRAGCGRRSMSCATPGSSGASAH